MDSIAKEQREYLEQRKLSYTDWEAFCQQSIKDYNVLKDKTVTVKTLTEEQEVIFRRGLLRGWMKGKQEPDAFNLDCSNC